MKKLFFIIIVLSIMLFITDNPIKINDKRKKQELISEKRAIYLSYIELEKYIKKSETESKENINKIINNIKNNNFNMLLLHVRSFSDSIYPSKYFPWSLKVSSEEGIDPGYDILDYFIKIAHKNNIEVHAWINPYRIRNNNDISNISKSSIAYSWLNTNNIEVSDKGIYYNPASSEVIDLVVNGVKELVYNYDIDGIHLDDYFYNSDTIDIDNYNEYKKNNNISLKDYRLMKVNELIEKIHKITKSKNILFGIAPDANIDNNYNKNYADVYKWGSSSKYVDYLMPQLYYGFYNESKPFYKTLKEWNNVVKKSNVKLMPALSLYKSGNIDEFAKSGKEEWINNDNILMRQIIVSRNIKSVIGFSIFRYDSMFDSDLTDKTVLNEINNIKKIIKD